MHLSIASKSPGGQRRGLTTGRFYLLPQFEGGSLQWRHNGRDGVSNHQPHDCLLNRLFRRRSKKTLKLRVTGLCAGNSPVTGKFPTQMASNAENVSIWWRHHVYRSCNIWFVTHTSATGISMHRIMLHRLWHENINWKTLRHMDSQGHLIFHFYFILLTSTWRFICHHLQSNMQGFPMMWYSVIVCPKGQLTDTTSLGRAV